MQVNLNPSVNHSRLNFKASFSDDIQTKRMLDSLNRTDFGKANVLATHYMLQDISSDDKISLIIDSNNTAYARNLTNGHETQLDEHHQLYRSDVRARRLRETIEDGDLIDEKPKLDSDVYRKRASDFLESTSKKGVSRASKLEQQIKKLDDKLKILKEKLSEVNHKTIAEKNVAVKREIFSLAKKVK